MIKVKDLLGKTKSNKPMDELLSFVGSVNIEQEHYKKIENTILESLSLCEKRDDMILYSLNDIGQKKEEVLSEFINLSEYEYHCNEIYVNCSDNIFFLGSMFYTYSTALKKTLKSFFQIVHFQFIYMLMLLNFQI